MTFYIQTLAIIELWMQNKSYKIILSACTHCLLQNILNLYFKQSLQIE